MGGLETTVTFGEMGKINLMGCADVDGVLGMGVSNDDGQNAFEDMLDVSWQRSLCSTFRCDKFSTCMC